jgi:ornithine lipid ester-linked acyl 2-hydroxylase
MYLRNDRSFQKKAIGGIADFIRNQFEIVIRISDGDKTFYDPKLFKWTSDIEGSYTQIRSELEKVLEHNLAPSWELISDDPNVKVGSRWKTFIFCAYGNYISKNCEICPETFKAIAHIEGLKTAWFSILEPGARLPVHEGPYNGVLRYHLGLMIPSEDVRLCGIRVSNETRSWKNGESLIFDDSFKHEAWNLTAERRVVLFVDFIRPLPWPVSWLNYLAIYLGSKSRFVQNLIKAI